jgi:glycosyl transferase family 87
VRPTCPWAYIRGDAGLGVANGTPQCYGLSTMVHADSVLESVGPLPSRLARRRYAQLVFGLIVFSAAIDVSLLRTWNQVNHGFNASDWLVYFRAAERLQAGGDPYRSAYDFLNPPSFLLLVRLALPLGYIPSRILWCSASLVMLQAGAYFTATSLVARPSWRQMALGSILIVLYAPTVLLIPTSSNATAPVLLGYALGLWCFTRRKDGWGGAALSLTVLIKPQLAFLTLPLLIYKRRWRAVAAYLAGSGAALLLSFWVLGPTTFLGFIRILRSTANGADTLTLWVRDIPGLHAMFLQLWPDSTPAGSIAYILGGVLVLALAYYWRGPWNPNTSRFVTGWAMVPLVDLLVVPYAHSDDLVLLIIPAVVLYWCTIRPSRPADVDRWVVPVLLALYLSPTFVVYFRLHFVAPAMLAALFVLWKLAPPQSTAFTPAIGRQLRAC